MPDQDLRQAIARKDVTGLAMMFWARLIAIALLAVWSLTLPFDRAGYYLLALGAFALLGAPPYLLAKRGIGGLPVVAGFLLLDAALLSYILIVPTPYTVEGWTPQLSLRLWNFLWLGVFLVGMALTYSPTLVICTGSPPSSPGAPAISGSPACPPPWRAPRAKRSTEPRTQKR